MPTLLSKELIDAAIFGEDIAINHPEFPEDPLFSLIGTLNYGTVDWTVAAVRYESFESLLSCATSRPICCYTERPNMAIDDLCSDPAFQESKIRIDSPFQKGIKMVDSFGGTEHFLRIDPEGIIYECRQTGYTMKRNGINVLKTLRTTTTGFYVPADAQKREVVALCDRLMAVSPTEQ